MKIDDKNLQITIGEWLGLFDHLNSNKKNTDEINSILKKILIMAGINPEEKCTLSDFVKEKLVFNCYLENSKENAKITLHWGTFVDFSPEFNISYKNKEKTFEFDKLHKDKSFSFNLLKEIEKSKINNNTYTRYYNPYFVSIILDNDEYKLELRVSNSNNIDISKIKDYKFELINEKEMKEYLLSLNFPIKIDEVYKNIDDMLMYSIGRYPKFKIEVYKKNKDSKMEITDKVVLNHGKLEEFTITKNGKTISINEDNSWTYNSEKISAYTDKDGKVGFSAKDLEKDKLTNLKTIPEEMISVNKDIEKVKKISKTL